MADLSRILLWRELVEKCPLECSLCEVDDTDLVESTGESGLPSLRYHLEYIEGTLTVEEEQFGWMFHHPGFNDGQKFIHALNGDTTPGYSHVFLHT